MLGLLALKAYYGFIRDKLQQTFKVFDSKLVSITLPNCLYHCVNGPRMYKICLKLHMTSIFDERLLNLV